MTQIFENIDNDLTRPEYGNWCRIKTGTYQGDLGIVDRERDSESIYVKLVPRLDPSTWIPKGGQK